jgi:hypothetical protein
MKFLKTTLWAIVICLSFQNCAKKAEEQKEEAAAG